MSINLSINIKQSDEEILKRITHAIRDKLNKSFDKMVSPIQEEVRKQLFDAIIRQPEYNAVIHGSLRLELGLIDGGVRLLNIIDAWIKNVDVTFKKFRASKSGLTGGIIVEAVASDYSDVLGMDDSILVTAKGEELPWLQWMLQAGGATIISDYRIQFGIGLGRTGGARMISGGSWGIPPQFAGTAKNNFVTRAIASIQDNLQIAIQNIIESRI